ncbi:LuxR C-terminal-related transcriptional regulator [Draconibacterium sp. IB214405]|uniref:response regulator transcription factor n=1 Tax=Draconibacterium sp. IB214405 TaxID=3097352 RepID=UPI002A0E4CE5|nr:LuxR C-terminal-related transcriptional regulator [Draconibacterium sp. IB214405]MDX8340378.1 LuxR C-terminal-related transcriptional regulator [Draconibacterium sp. IB214405]
MTYRTDQLNTTRLQNMEAHNCAVDESDYERIRPKIELLQRLAEAERSMYAIFDMHKGNYLLKSSEQQKLFGKALSDEHKNFDADLIYQNIHPDDLSFVLETDNLTYRFFASLPADEKKDYKLVYDFRIRNTEGNYLRYMHQVIILEQDKNGRSWLSLIISDLLPEQAANSKCQRRMINLKTGKLHFLTDEEKSNTEYLLTKRERQVLELIALGYDSKSISEKLFISVNTVNNHRQNILRKTRAENTTQALLYAKRLGII